MKQKDWAQFYASSGGTDYFIDHLAIHKEFIKEILDGCPRNVLEAGCGSAVMSVFLAMSGLTVMACDNDEAVLAKGRENARFWNANVTLVKKDLLSLDFPDDSFDAVFCQGVLEHFADDQIRQIVSGILKTSPRFIFSVPGPYYRHKDFGNERLLSESDWKKILEPVGRVRTRSYYERRTKRNFLLKRPLMILGVLERAHRR